MSEIFFGAYCDVDTCCLSWHKLKSYFGYIGTPYCTVYKCGFGILDRVTGFVSLLHVSVIALYFVPANSDYEMIDNLNRRCA